MPTRDLEANVGSSGPRPVEVPAALVALVYADLRRLAHHYLRQERSGHTLQATALVHEVYLRLAPNVSVDASAPSHFVALAGHLMRQILVEYARGRKREKRGGKDQRRVPLEEGIAVIDPAECDRWEVLDEALDRLAQLSQRQSQIVELRYFGGLTVDEVASALCISPKTVKRDWSLARAWLRRELADGTQSSDRGR
jgi:RNA polymerase sigma factor (TIGR02999 family)